MMGKDDAIDMGMCVGERMGVGVTEGMFMGLWV